jgi:hypothetical protein
MVEMISCITARVAQGNLGDPERSSLDAAPIIESLFQTDVTWQPPHLPAPLGPTKYPQVPSMACGGLRAAGAASRVGGSGPLIPTGT